MTLIRRIAVAATVASALAAAPAALADQPAGAAATRCTCWSAQPGDTSAQRADGPAAKAPRDARQVRAEQEDHDAFLQRVWTAP